MRTLEKTIALDVRWGGLRPEGEIDKARLQNDCARSTQTPHLPAASVSPLPSIGSLSYRKFLRKTTKKRDETHG
jgi:hypothetical protein